MTVGNNFFDLNAGRNYPLDDSATGISNDGINMPSGILVDVALRYPNTLGTFAYISGIQISEKITSIIISAGTSLTDATLRPIASLVLGGRAQEGKVYALTALADGVAGWVVFGSLASVAYAGRFSTAQQTLLLPKVARAYTALPVPWASKTQDEIKLEDVVGLFGGRDVSVTREERVIEDVVREALIIQLDGDPTTVLQKYTGPCGGRPESLTCNARAIESINGVLPDASGNIVLNFEGFQVVPLPNGLLVSSDLALPEICPTPVVDDVADTDYCASFSDVSISDSSSVLAGSSAAGSSVGTSLSSSVMGDLYPACFRIYEGQPLDFTLSPPWPNSGWSLEPFTPSPSYMTPPIYPCAVKEGVEPEAARFLRQSFGANPGRHTAILNAPQYVITAPMRIRIGFRQYGLPSVNGLVLDYRTYAGLEYFTAIVFQGANDLGGVPAIFGLRQWHGNGWTRTGPQILTYETASEVWYHIDATLTPSERLSGRVNMNISLYRQVGASTLRPAGSLVLPDFPGIALNSGKIGWVVDVVNCDFGYLYLDAA